MKIIAGFLVFMAAMGFYVATTLPKADISETVGRLLLPMLFLIGGAWCWDRGKKSKSR
jgi:hypothetical protein